MIYFNTCLFYWGVTLKMLYNCAMLIWLFIYPTSAIFEGYKHITGEPCPDGIRFIYSAAALHSCSWFVDCLKLCLARYRKVNYHLQNWTMLFSLGAACMHVLEAAEELKWFSLWAIIEFISVIWCLFVLGLPMKGAVTCCPQGCCYPGCCQGCCHPGCCQGLCYE